MNHDERIDKALDNQLSPDEWAQLQSDIIENEELRTAYVDRAWLHGQLRAERDRLPQLLESDSPQPAKSQRWLPVTWAAAATIALLGAILFRDGSDSEAVATLIEAEDCRWAGSELPTAQGAKLGPGKLALVEGMATLQFESGATVTLEAPSTLEVLSKMRCRLVEGSVVADVPESAHGFTIDTTDLEVVDLGTRFGVTASPYGHSHVLVFEGEVEVGQGSDEPKRLTTGNSLHFGKEPPAPNEEIAHGVTAIESEDGWTSLPAAKDAYVRRGDPHGPTGTHPLIMVKQTDLAEGNVRRAYLTFDLSSIPLDSVRDAELVLDVEPSGLGFSALVPDSRFAIYGIETDQWSEREMLWNSAPVYEDGRKLAEFSIRRGASPANVKISSSDLAAFVRGQGDGQVTFVVVRETGETDRQGLVHAFASREHPAALPPTLRLKTF